MTHLRTTKAWDLRNDKGFKNLITGTADFSLTQLQLWVVRQNDYMQIYFRYIFMVTVISKLRTRDMCMLQK
jgi:hypothetical protein